MSFVCKKISRIDKCYVFLKKAIEYAWLLNDRDQELNLYEELGIISYLDGNLNNSKIYHRRFNVGIFQ